MKRGWARCVGVGLVAVAGATAAAGADPEVSNVRAVQRAGTRLVDIAYDLAATGLVSVSAAVSANGGVTFDVPCPSLSGVGSGSGVAPGAGKAMVWDAGADWPGHWAASARVKVLADDGRQDYWPAPYPTIGWPAQHHDAHNSDWIPASYPRFRADGHIGKIEWWLRSTNNPVVCVGGGVMGVVGTNEYFIVTSGKIRSPNLWLFDMANGSLYWSTASPTNAVDPGPDSFALTVSPVVDRHGSLYLADSRYLYRYPLARQGSPGAPQPWLWRVPMPNLKTYNTNDGLWHPSSDPAAPDTKGSPFMSLVLTPEVDGRYYVGGVTVEGEFYMFDHTNGALFAQAYLETNVIGVVTGAPPGDPYAFAATNDPFAPIWDTNNPIFMGIWATGAQTDDPDLDYFMNPIQLKGYLAAGTFGGGPMIANNPCLARDPTNAAKCRLYVPGRQSSESARYDTDTNTDAVVYRVDFDPTQGTLTGRLSVLNYDYPVTPGKGRFDGRMVNGRGSATSPDLSRNERWLFCGDKQGIMYNLDADTGAMVWEYPVGDMLGSPTTWQVEDANGWFTFMSLANYEPWIAKIDAQTGQIVSNAVTGLMVRHLSYGPYITNYCWRTEPAYQEDFYTPITHELWPRKAIGASIILAASNLFEIVYSAGWQRPNDPSGGLWLVPTHLVVMVLDPEKVWAFTNLAPTIQGAYLDTNGTSEVGLIMSPAARPRGVLFYGSQSCCVAQYLDFNNMLPNGMENLYLRPYGGLGLFELPFEAAADTAPNRLPVAGDPPGSDPAGNRPDGVARSGKGGAQ